MIIPCVPDSITSWYWSCGLSAAVVLQVVTLYMTVTAALTSIPSGRAVIGTCCCVSTSMSVICIGGWSSLCDVMARCGGRIEVSVSERKSVVVLLAFFARMRRTICISCVIGFTS